LHLEWTPEKYAPAATASTEFRSRAGAGIREKTITAAAQVAATAIGTKTFRCR
jgi:hypothetical protein